MLGCYKSQSSVDKYPSSQIRKIEGGFVDLSRRNLANTYRKEQWENPYYLAMTTVFAAVLGGIGTLLFVSIQERLYSLLTLSFLFFLTTIYAWLYLSRILVFVEESPAGEFFSFLLAASGFGAPIALAALGKSSMTYWTLGLIKVQLWAVVGSIPVVLWALKCIQLRLMLYRDKRKDHPNIFCVY